MRTKTTQLSTADATFSALAVPAAAAAQVWLDFDGTVTEKDFLDELVGRYSRNGSWRLIEEQWRAGLIGSRACLTQEFSLLDISAAELAGELARVRLDPGAAALLGYLAAMGVPAAILSDGAEEFIRAILRAHGVEAPPVRANSVEHSGRSLALRCPHASASCERGAAHCKCASARDLGAPDRRSIYIGDGLSDLCAARKADLVFAKGALASALAREQRPFLCFATLGNVRAVLAHAWGARPGCGEAPR